MAAFRQYYLCRNGPLIHGNDTLFPGLMMYESRDEERNFLGHIKWDGRDLTRFCAKELSVPPVAARGASVWNGGEFRTKKFVNNGPIPPPHSTGGRAGDDPRIF